MRSSWNTCAVPDELSGIRGAASYAVILGSGLAALADIVAPIARIPYGRVPGLGATTVEGHPGFVSLGRIAGEPVLLFAGRFHAYEGVAPDRLTSIVSLAAGVGCRRIIVTQAAGSLTPRIHPGTWMLMNDALWFPTRIGADLDRGTYRARAPRSSRRVGASLASRRLSARIRAAARTALIPLAEGVLCWMNGPTYETAAEARAAALMGADAVTMSSFPELLAARRLGLQAASLSWITNEAAHISGERTDHAHVIGMGEAGARTLRNLLEAYFCARRAV
jgi:purine-nucleoside phosphorylase